MTFEEMDDAVRNMVRRVTLSDLDFSDSAHLRGAFSGLVGQQLKRAVISQGFGHYSEPMAGASALVLSLGGRSDRAHVIGFDDPRYRPKNLGAGASAIYDASGQIISLVKKNIRIVSPERVAIEAGQVTINGREVVTR